MSERTLIVGGTGLTGAHAALHLQQLGHQVTLMSRSPVEIEVLKPFDHLCADYTDNTVPEQMLAQFDQLVFAAGADIRSAPQGEAEQAFYARVNTEAIPAFMRSARDAGVARAVYIGTYYPQVAPEAIATSAYVRSRHLADEAVRALNTEGFCVCSLNAPFIIGHVEGLPIAHLQMLVDYARGRMEGVPMVAPGGGVNHISSQSMSEAIEGALARGEGGRAYLVGDENLSWKQYLEMFCEAVGQPRDLPVSTDEHPLFPDSILYAGRNAVVAYEPDNGELGYSRNQIRNTILQVVRACS